MADRSLAPDTPELRERWGGFEFTESYRARADRAIARYPEGRQRSAVMPLLDLAQRQVGEETNTQGWLPLPVIEYVADYLDMPVIRVLEVATFYFMYNLRPVGKYHVQVCGTTPCMLRGSDGLLTTVQGAEVRAALVIAGELEAGMGVPRGIVLPPVQGHRGGIAPDSPRDGVNADVPCGVLGGDAHGVISEDQGPVGDGSVAGLGLAVV